MTDLWITEEYFKNSPLIGVNSEWLDHQWPQYNCHCITGDWIINGYRKNVIL